MFNFPQQINQPCTLKFNLSQLLMIRSATYSVAPGIKGSYFTQYLGQCSFEISRYRHPLTFFLLSPLVFQTIFGINCIVPQKMFLNIPIQKVLTILHFFHNIIPENQNYIVNSITPTVSLLGIIFFSQNFSQSW